MFSPSEEQRRKDDHLDACRKAALLIQRHAMIPPATSEKRAHAKNTIESAINRANRIGKPLGLTFERTMSHMMARQARRFRIVRLGRQLIGVGLVTIAFGLIAWVLHLLAVW